MLEGAKSIGAGAATIALAGAAIGIGNVFSSLINSVARNPSFCLESFVKLFSDIHFRLVIIIVESSPLLRMAFSIALIVSTSSSICFMFGGGSGGIEDAIVPFLSRNGNPDPGLPPSSSGEPLGLVIAGQGETSTSLLEIPSVAEEDLWDAVDLQEQPLISDAERREILVDKLLEHGLNPDTKRSSALLEEQILFEKTLEKHLRRCGYTDKDIGRVFPELRPKFLYYRGKARKIEDLTKWIRDMELNFKGSSPYKKIQNLLILFTPQELGKE